MMPLPSDSAPDDPLIARVQAGDTAAFGLLLDRHLPAVRAFVALKLPVAHLVDEIAHEAFVFAFRHIGEFTVGTSFRAWLRAIAWQLTRAEIQRFAREEQNQSRYAQARLAELAAQADRAASTREAEHLEECLARLPENLRRLLALKYTEGRTSEEIAHAFARTLEWVRVTLFRVRQQLRACIENKTGHA